MDENTSPVDVVRDHIRGFNAVDVDATVAGFAEDAVFNTGTTVVTGKATLREWFGTSMADLAPVLSPSEFIATADTVAVELIEEIDADDKLHRFHIAGFYRVRDGLIVSAKIYREGSADWPPPETTG